MTMNPYEVLGIQEGASMDEIKRAYRRKAKEYHPDLHPDDPNANEKMQRVNEAYDRLCNPEKYRARPQPRPKPGSYARDPFGGRQRQYGSGNWHYYTWNGADDWGGAWDASQRPHEDRQSAGAINPLRGVARFISGIIIFRFILFLFRLLLFGYL